MGALTFRRKRRTHTYKRIGFFSLCVTLFRLLWFCFPDFSLFFFFWLPQFTALWLQLDRGVLCIRSVCLCVCVRVFVKQHDYGRLHNRICEISCVNRLQSHPRISSSCVKCSVNELRTKVIDTCYVGKWPFRLGWWSTARKSMKFNAMRSFVCLLMLCTHKHTKCGWNISVLLVILRWTWFIKSLCWWLCVRWANAKPQYLFIRGFIHVFFICCRCFTLKEKIMHFFRVLYIVAFILETMTCGS